MADKPQDNTFDNNPGGNPEKVLRAMDIFPPFDKSAEQIKSKNYREDLIPPLKSAKSATVEDTAAQKPQDSVNENAIPKFNLAQQILSEQRKITAEKRKLRSNDITNRENTAKSQPVKSPKTNSPEPNANHEWENSDQTIKIIVARDISKMLGGK